MANICVFLEPTSFFYTNALRGEVKLSFSKCCVDKKITMQSEVKFSSVLKN